MKQFPILDGKAYVVELPEGAVSFQESMGYIRGRCHNFENWCPNSVILNPSKLEKWLEKHSPEKDYKDFAIKLPAGNWQIVGRLPEVTEEEAAGLVKHHDIYLKGVKEPRLGFLDYNRSNKAFEFYTYKNALESLESVILAAGYYLDVNPLGAFDDFDKQVFNHSKERLAEWKTAQSRVISRERALILKKI